MSTFSTNGNSASCITGAKIRIEKIVSTSTKKSEVSKTKEIWAEAKSYAHNQLWYGWCLPGLLESEGVDTKNMNITQMVNEISHIWSMKEEDEVQPQITVVMDFSHEDILDKDYEGLRPSRFDKEKNERVTVRLNALASIGSNDFRSWVMRGDEEWKDNSWARSPVIPGNCFFGTYPVKNRGEIIKGKFRLVLQPHK